MQHSRDQARLKLALLFGTALVAAAGLATGPALAQPAPGAMPTGGRVAAGAASIGQTAQRTTVAQSSDRAVLEWQQFNVGSQHAVEFRQPNAASWTLNRVTGGDPSAIAGRITANGGIAIVNQSGVVFTEGAQVNVGSLIASAANVTTQNFMAGRMAFDGTARPGARVENRGTVTVAQRGLAALVGPEVANSGTINARLGKVALAAGEAFALDLAGDGMLSIDVTPSVRQAPGGGAALLTNSGTIRAEGGSVLLTAHAASGLVENLVAHSGRIEAPTSADGRAGQVALRAMGGNTTVAGSISTTGGAGLRGGSVEVNATGTVTLAGSAVVDASGDTGGGRVAVGLSAASRAGAPQNLARRTVVQPGARITADAGSSGDGGSVTLHAAQLTDMRGSVSARGGAQGGDGGEVEVSSQAAFAMDGRVDVSAPRGRLGNVLYDPVELRVVSSLTGSLEPAEITAAAVGGTSGNLTLSASSIIRVNAAISKPTGNLALTTTNASGGAIYLDANILLGNGLVTSGTFTATTNGTIFQNGGTQLQVSNTITLNGGGVSLAGTLFNPDLTPAAINVNATGAVADAAANFGGILALGNIIIGGGNITLASTNSYVVVAPAAWLASHASLAPSAGGAVQPATGYGGGGGSIDAAGTLALTSGREIAFGGSLFGGQHGLTPPTGNAVRLIAGTDIALDGFVSGKGGGTASVSAAVFIQAQGAISNSGGIFGVASATANSGSVRLDTTLTSSSTLPSSNPTGGAITNSGTIAAARNVLITANAGFSNNAGGSLAGSGIGTTGNAVQVTAGGNLINAGNISGTGGGGLNFLGTGTSAAVVLVTGGWLDNTGTIIGSANAGVASSGGVYLDSRGMLATTGATSLYASPGTTIVNSGTIRGDHYVIANAATDFTQSNTGAIAGGLALGTTSTPAVNIMTGGGLINQGTITGTGGSASQSAVVLRADGTLQNQALVRGLALTSGGSPVADTGGVRLDTTGATNVGDAAVFTHNGAIINSGTVVADGRLSVTSLANIFNTGSRAAGQALLPSVTTMRLFAQTAVSNLGTLATGQGDMDIRGPATVVLGTAQAAGAISATSANGVVAITAPVSATTLSLSSGTNIQQAASGAGISAGTLLASAAGNVALDGAGNQVAVLGTSSAGGNFTLVDASSLTTTGKLTASGNVSLSSAGSLSLQGAVDPTIVTLIAAGDITQAANGAGVTATTLLLTAGGSVNLGGGGNQVLALGASSAGGDLMLVNLGSLTASSGLSAGGSLQLTTSGALLLGSTLRAETLTALGGSLVLDGAQLTLGRGGLLAAPGGFTALSPSLLAALDPLRLPVLVLDGRGSGALAGLPGFVQPDRPGLASAAQPTQLDDFGTPRAAAAQSLALNLSAGDSPVFLLVDSATVSGVLNAGRVGLFGLGGAASLEGLLNGIGGPAAASQAFIVVAGGSFGLSNYLYNGSQFTPTQPVLDSLVTFPTNILINFSDAGGGGSGTGGGSSGVVGGGAGGGNSSGGPTLTERTEATEAVLAEASPPVAPRASFVRRFLPPSSVLRTRATQSRFGGGDVEVPNAGGRDF